MGEFIRSLESNHLMFIFALLFIIIFWRSLNKFISGITSIDKSGLKVGSAPEAQRKTEKKEAAEELLKAIDDSAVLKEMEDRIIIDLKKKGLDAEGDTISVLVKNLAVTQILLNFEQIYNLIFGSQISLLKKLNTVAGQGISKEKIQSHFDHIQKIYKEPLGDWSLERYLEFMFGKSLICNSDNKYLITNLGVEYLIWMARNGKPEIKGL